MGCKWETTIKRAACAPTTTTARAAASLKSAPSLARPRITARSRAPSQHPTRAGARAGATAPAAPPAEGHGEDRATSAAAVSPEKEAAPALAAAL